MPEHANKFNNNSQKLPTVCVGPDGTERWKLNGKLHRVDGPAIENSDGGRSWLINDQLHRDGGPAYEYGSELQGGWWIREWYIKGQRHREDGPAVEDADGYKAWYINNERHREYEPAVKGWDGHEEWWINGKKLNEKEIAIQKELKKENDLQQLEDEIKKGLPKPLAVKGPVNFTKNSSL